MFDIRRRVGVASPEIESALAPCKIVMTPKPRVVLTTARRASIAATRRHATGRNGRGISQPPGQTVPLKFPLGDTTGRRPAWLPPSVDCLPIIIKEPWSFKAPENGET